jgi:RHS repeat-associated protein
LNITSETGWTYVYDLSNKLIRVLSGSNQVAEYTYNGAGQRIKKVTQTETRIFHYDLLGHLIAETNQNGQMFAEYVYLGDQLLTLIKPGELAYYFHNDHLGTPQVLTDDSQTVAWKAAYTPFGGAVPSIETVENPFRFPGQYYDQETGLHYNYFRYYDPSTGRYITPDPIGLEGGINLFSYAANNPINHIDTRGLRVFYNGHVVNTSMEVHLEILSQATGYDIHLISGTRNGPFDDPNSQHFTGNAADFYMTTEAGTMVPMTEAAEFTADYGEFTGIGYYSGGGPHGAHVHADLRDRILYWSETDFTGYHYNTDSAFWWDYLRRRLLRLYRGVCGRVR